MPTVEGASWVEADLTDLQTGEVAAGAGRIDVAFHLAAVGLHEPRPRSAVDVVRENVLGTVALLELARETGAARVVNCGSGHEYGAGSRLSEDAPLRGTSVYGASKAAAWHLLDAGARRSGIPLVGLRPFTVYGPGDSPHALLGAAVAAAASNQPMEFTEGGQTRDFVYVDDVVDALVVAASHARAPGSIFNVCTGVETSVRDAVSLVFDLAGSEAGPVFGAKRYRAGRGMGIVRRPEPCRECSRVARAHAAARRLDADDPSARGPRR